MPSDSAGPLPQKGVRGRSGRPDIITRFVSVVSEGCSTAGPPRLLAQELMITNITTKAEKKLEKNTLLQFFLDILLPNPYYGTTNIKYLDTM